MVSARQAHRLNKEWGSSPVGINIRFKVRLAPPRVRNQLRKELDFKQVYIWRSASLKGLSERLSCVFAF